MFVYRWLVVMEEGLENFILFFNLAVHFSSLKSCTTSVTNLCRFLHLYYSYNNSKYNFFLCILVKNWFGNTKDVNSQKKFQNEICLDMFMYIHIVYFDGFVNKYLTSCISFWNFFWQLTTLVLTNQFFTEKHKTNDIG